MSGDKIFRGMKFSEDQIGELAFDQATIMDLPLLATLRRAGQGEIKDRKQDAFYDLWERGLELYSQRRYEERQPSFGRRLSGIL